MFQKMFGHRAQTFLPRNFAPAHHYPIFREIFLTQFILHSRLPCIFHTFPVAFLSYTFPIPLLYLSYTFPIPFPYSPHTLLILSSYSLHTLFIHSSYTPHTLLILSSYSLHTLFIHSSYSPHTLLILSSYTLHTLLILSSYSPKKRRKETGSLFIYFLKDIFEVKMLLTINYFFGITF